MIGNLTFGQKVGAAMALTVVLSMVIAAVAVYALRSVVTSKDRVIDVQSRLLEDTQALNVSLERKSSESRAFLLTNDERYVAEMQAARRDLTAAIARLKESVTTEEGRLMAEAIERIEAEHQQELDQVISLQRANEGLDLVLQAFDTQVIPKRNELNEIITGFVSHQEGLLVEATTTANQNASSTIIVVLVISGASVLLTALLAILLARTLARDIGTAVGQVQSSSAELQTAANQQATGANQQATAMNEMSTTTSEFLATSRQIAESAQLVADIAGQTAASAQAGEETVERSSESIMGIQQQVDLIVSHMLELGRKSQHIGAVLDIVSELAEQTNILSINATIEAAGAGESGQRFAVVADEIRKLADRVAGSTKEIRELIEDVRSAVNTTIMATESGSKAVDNGAKQFTEVAAAFKQIAALVSTTTEAAREIELSTRQQASALEQVNVAVADAAQATKETETSSNQVLQTASQLAATSRELLALVRRQEAM